MGLMEWIGRASFSDALGSNPTPSLQILLLYPAIRFPVMLGALRRAFDLRYFCTRVLRLG